MFVFVVLISLCYAATEAATPCCTHRRFQATLLELGGQTNLTSGVGSAIAHSMRMYYDYDNQRQFIISTPRPPSQEKGYRMFQDFVTRKSYYLSAVGSTLYCTVLNMQPEETMPPPCVQANATLKGSHYFGSAGQNVQAHTWSYYDENQVNIETTVTDDECTPLSVTSSGLIRGFGRTTTMLFLDFKAGISEVYRMQIPAICERPAVGK
ncbi:hypothetical protein ScPMuIL_004178 [Solemya velum]